MKQNNQIRQVVFPLLAALIWGTAFVAQDMCADVIDAMTFNAAALSGANAGYVAGEVERYGAGVLMQCGKDPARGIQLADGVIL